MANASGYRYRQGKIRKEISNQVLVQMPRSPGNQGYERISSGSLLKINFPLPRLSLSYFKYRLTEDLMIFPGAPIRDRAGDHQ